MQYQSECLSALKSVANIHKPFEKAFMDTMKLFMAIPDRINFLQLGRYGCFSEQTYRNLFEHETFDWFAFNGSIISKHLTGKRKAIAIDPSYIPKSGKKTPWIGYFWSGCAGEYKRGLEIMGIGVIDIDNHECMTLGSIQTPDCKTLDNMDKNLVDWYSCYLISRKTSCKAYPKRWLQTHSFQGNFRNAYVRTVSMLSAALGMMLSCTIRHWKRKQENVVIPSGLTAGLTLPIWI